MSNKTRLQTNNTNLQALIDKANALPDAGSGGGASVETCTVTISGNYSHINTLVGTTRDGACGYGGAVSQITTTYEFLKNSFIAVVLTSGKYSLSLESDALTFVMGTEASSPTYYIMITGDGSFSVS